MNVNIIGEGQWLEDRLALQATILKYGVGSIHPSGRQFMGVSQYLKDLGGLDYVELSKLEQLQLVRGMLKDCERQHFQTTINIAINKDKDVIVTLKNKQAELADGSESLKKGLGECQAAYDEEQAALKAAQG